MSIAEPSYAPPADPLTDLDGSADVVLTIATTALNEAPNVRPFLDAAVVALNSLRVSGEILFIDDGSTDGTSAAVAEYAREHFDTPIRLIRHRKPRGLAAAINESAVAARGTFLCLVPADLESDPAEDVPKLFRAMDDQTDFVLGQRIGRNDKKQLASNIYNRFNAWLFGIRARDANWIKLVRTDRLDGIQLRNDWHPFLAAILAKAGCRFKTVDTTWHSRKHGHSKFGIRRFPKSAAAAVSVKFHLMFGTRPLVFFLAASAGMGSAAIALLACAFLVDASSARLWTFLLGFSAASFAASWLSLIAGLAVDALAYRPSRRADL
jgi:glycosyltransferase involved in cell wall biosynthesis